jgi:hypothetical protein
VINPPSFLFFEEMKTVKRLHSTNCAEERCETDKVTPFAFPKLPAIALVSIGLLCLTGAIRRRRYD